MGDCESMCQGHFHESRVRGQDPKMTRYRPSHHHKLYKVPDHLQTDAEAKLAFLKKLEFAYIGRQKCRGSCMCCPVLHFLTEWRTTDCDGPASPAQPTCRSQLSGQAGASGSTWVEPAALLLGAKHLCLQLETDMLERVGSLPQGLRF